MKKFFAVLVLFFCIVTPAFASRSGPDPLHNFLENGGTIVITKGNPCKVVMSYKLNNWSIEFDEECEYSQIQPTIRRGASNALRLLID